ncbi:MAG: GntR family transcriptional regulator [Lachnospiraceae bacterium]|nr:GntR family transcriptional regulator [Lachnospiraceae bacterium]
MLTYTFSSTDSEPLYGQLYRFMKEDIVTGVLTADEKLPSKRSFAKNLGISTITVENAYAQLIAEGYVYSLPKRGFFVTDIRNALLIQRERVGRKNER